MKKVILSILFYAYVTSGWAKDVTFSCTGSIEEDYKLSTKSENYQIKDKIGLLVRDKEISVTGSQYLEIPMVYKRNGTVSLESDFTFPICSKKNYEISANNYSCDIELISKYEKNLPNKMGQTFEIKFNGLTNILNISYEPTFEKRLQREERKIAYKTQHGIYQCKVASSSF